MQSKLGQHASMGRMQGLHAPCIEPLRVRPTTSSLSSPWSQHSTWFRQTPSSSAPLTQTAATPCGHHHPCSQGGLSRPQHPSYTAHSTSLRPSRCLNSMSRVECLRGHAVNPHRTSLKHMTCNASNQDLGSTTSHGSDSHSTPSTPSTPSSTGATASISTPSSSASGSISSQPQDAIKISSLATALGISQAQAQALSDQAPKLLTKSPQALAAKCQYVAQAVGAGMGVAEVVEMMQGAPELLLKSPSHVVSRLQVGAM